MDESRPARLAARIASLRVRVRMPVKARCTPFKVSRAPERSLGGGVLSASINSSALS